MSAVRALRAGPSDAGPARRCRRNRRGQLPITSTPGTTSSVRFYSFRIAARSTAARRRRAGISHPPNFSTGDAGTTVSAVYVCDLSARTIGLSPVFDGSERRHHGRRCHRQDHAGATAYTALSQASNDSHRRRPDQCRRPRRRIRRGHAGPDDTNPHCGRGRPHHGGAGYCSPRAHRGHAHGQRDR